MADLINLEILASHIRSLRESHGLSQDYMASMLTISLEEYQAIEKDAGKTPVTRLVQIAELL